MTGKVYSHCIFCHQPLGSNQALEEQPVGRRIAFDLGRGRLWVVCGRCARWNLSPIETRWEAVEACERAYRGTRVRVATENIGMARVAEGLELIRIGAPEMPEFAAWRYARQMVRRRYRALAVGALATATLPAFYGIAWGTGLIPFASGYWFVRDQLRKRLERRVLVRVPLPSGAEWVMRRNQIHNFAWVPGSEGGAWGLDVTPLEPEELTRAWRARDKRAPEKYLQSLAPDLRVTGDEAIRIGRVVLAAANRSSGSPRCVGEAVRLIDEVGDPFSPAEPWHSARHHDPISLFFDWRRKRAGLPLHTPGSPVLLTTLPAAVRLAREMAANEDSERRAMEGELHVLEAAWREAEEIARIADAL
jgi:hypothetical protein